MYLTNTRLTDAEKAADLAQVQFLLVIERQDELFPLRESFNRPDNAFAKSIRLKLMEWALRPFPFLGGIHSNIDRMRLVGIVQTDEPAAESIRRDCVIFS